MNTSNAENQQENSNAIVPILEVETEQHGQQDQPLLKSPGTTFSTSPLQETLSQRTPSPSNPAQEQSANKGIVKLKGATHKLYHSESDFDVSKFDICLENLPEVFSEIFFVNFYEERFIPEDETYHPRCNEMTLEASDTKVEFEELVLQSKLQNFISVIGYPGAGKTTLSKRLARRLSQDTDFLVLRLLFLNMSDCANEKVTLKEFLVGNVNFNLDEEEKRSAFSWIQTNPEKCCLIFDGFDQVNWNIEENVKNSTYEAPLNYWELVSNLCQGKFLCNCHIVFTSRPHAMLKIPPRCRPSRTYFMRDLTFDDMKKLFYALVNNEQKAAEMWDALRKNAPHLESICHNPLMLQLYLRASLGSTKESEYITTMTRIFHKVLENLNASGHAVSAIKLARIAYKATKRRTVLITTEDLKEEDKDLTSDDIQDLVVTLLGANKEFGLLEGKQRLYFTHQTFQEYFAALHISREMSLNEFASFIENSMPDDHWSVVELFLSGLLLDPSMKKDPSFYEISPGFSHAAAPTAPQTSFSLLPQLSQKPSLDISHQSKSSSQRFLSASQPESKLKKMKRNFKSFFKNTFSQSSRKSSKTSPHLCSSHELQTDLSKSGVSQQSSNEAFPSFARPSTSKQSHKFQHSGVSNSASYYPQLLSQSSPPVFQPEQSEKRGKKNLFVSEVNQQAEEIARSVGDPRVLRLCNILRECNDEDVIKDAASRFCGGWMNLYDIRFTMRDEYSVACLIKAIPGRIQELGLLGCEMTSHVFLPLVEAIKVMPGSIGRLNIRGNFLTSVHDVIEVLNKFEEEVDMQSCIDDENGTWRHPNTEERDLLQQALNELENTKLKIRVGKDEERNPIYLQHKNHGTEW